MTRERVIIFICAVVFGLAVADPFSVFPWFWAVVFFGAILWLLFFGIRTSPPLGAIDVYRIPDPFPHRFPLLIEASSFGAILLADRLLDDHPWIKFAVLATIFALVFEFRFARESHTNKLRTKQTREAFHALLHDPEQAQVAASEKPLIMYLLKWNAMDGTRVRTDFLASELAVSEQDLLRSAAQLRQHGLATITDVAGSQFVELTSP